MNTIPAAYSSDVICPIFPSVAKRAGMQRKWVTGTRWYSKKPIRDESGETQLLGSEPATCTCNLYVRVLTTVGYVTPPPAAHQGLSLPTYSGDHLPE